MLYEVITFSDALAIVNAMRDISASPAASPLVLTGLKNIESMYYMLIADGEHCIAAVEDGLRVARETGVQLWSYQILVITSYSIHYTKLYERIGLPPVSVSVAISFAVPLKGTLTGTGPANAAKPVRSRLAVSAEVSRGGGGGMISVMGSCTAVDNLVSVGSTSATCKPA